MCVCVCIPVAVIASNRPECASDLRSYDYVSMLIYRAKGAFYGYGRNADLRCTFVFGLAGIAQHPQACIRIHSVMHV